MQSGQFSEIRMVNKAIPQLHNEFAWRASGASKSKDKRLERLLDHVNGEYHRAKTDGQDIEIFVKRLGERPECDGLSCVDPIDARPTRAAVPGEDDDVFVGVVRGR